MDDELITPAQIRAARGLLGWSQEDLASAAKVGLSTVKDIETGKRDPIAANLDAIRRALVNAGAKFIPSNDDGPGVRFAAGHRPQVIRKPTRMANEMLPFRVAWRNQKVIVFLPGIVLDDLDGTDHSNDADFVAAFHRHERLILEKTAAAIDAGRATGEGHLRLRAADFPERPR